MISDINYAVAFWTSRIGARGGGADNANGHHATKWNASLSASTRHTDNLRNCVFAWPRRVVFVLGRESMGMTYTFMESWCLCLCVVIMIQKASAKDKRNSLFYNINKA